MAAGIREAFELGEGGQRRARERIVGEFPMEQRETEILRVVDEALSG